MQKLIKPVILLCVIIVAGTLIYDHFTASSSSDNKKSSMTDYEKISLAAKAAHNVAHSKEVLSLGTQMAWIIFDVQIIYSQELPAYKALANILGEDFDSVLSNGDRLFIGFLPAQGYYRVYAGDPNDKNNELAPEWKYTKLKNPGSP